MTDKQALPARNRTERGKRVPMGTPSIRLEVPVVPGYSCRWINDQDDRINRATNGGYEFLLRTDFPNYGLTESMPGNTDLGDKVSRIVGTARAGGPLRAYLMKIKQEWFDEDQAAKLGPVMETEKAIREGMVGKKEDDGRYVKDISIRRN